MLADRIYSKEKINFLTPLFQEQLWNLGEDPAKLAPHTIHTKQEEMQIVFGSISKSYFPTPWESFLFIRLAKGFLHLWRVLHSFKSERGRNYKCSKLRRGEKTLLFLVRYNENYCLSLIITRSSVIEKGIRAGHDWWLIPILITYTQQLEG